MIYNSHFHIFLSTFFETGSQITAINFPFFPFLALTLEAQACVCIINGRTAIVRLSPSIKGGIEGFAEGAHLTPPTKWRIKAEKLLRTGRQALFYFMISVIVSRDAASWR